MAAAIEKRALVYVFAFAFALCALLTRNHVVSWNDGSRIATIDALTADHTFAIEGSPYAANMGDKIRFRGHTYSDKPPLLSVLGAAVAECLAPAGITLRRTPGTAIYLITLLTVGVSFAIACAYAYAFGRRLRFSRRLAAAVAALSGVGTLALPYATVLTNHVPCGAAALAACYHLERARDGGGKVHTAVAGLCLGLAYAIDAAAVTVAIAAAVLLWGRPLRDWLLCAAAGVPIVVLQMAYNVEISGSIMPTLFNAAVWNDPSLPQQSWAAKIFAVYSVRDYFDFTVNLLVGGKGLFSYTPLMFVAAYGFAIMLRAGGRSRRLAIAILATTLVYFLSIVIFINDTVAGHFGERRYVDLIFLLCIALGPALMAIRGATARLAVQVAVVASVAIAALGTVAPFGGAPGEAGFVYGTAEFVALVHRAPVQAALDVLLLFVLLAGVLRLVPFGAALQPATPRPPRA
jgi:hypothetical protein